MGGDRESFAKAESTPRTGSIGTAEGATIRFHDSAGMVHFHDDTNKLKVTVPVAEWWKAWEDLRSQPNEWEWIDATNKTLLKLQSDVTNGLVDVKIWLKSIAVGDNYRALSEFTKR